MKTYYFRDLVKIEAENLSAAQIKECESLYGELVAVKIPTQGVVLNHNTDGINNKAMQNRFVNSIKDFEEKTYGLRY